MNITLTNSWNKILQDEFEKSYFQQLQAFVKEEYQTQNCYPKENEIFYAFEKTPFEKIKVVILGQDPYHGIGQAHGLCFSVPVGIAFPPSLKNIFIELKNDLGIEKISGNLTSWAEQGVFLLNSTLSVRSGEAGSHQKKGWETFTDEVIKIISNQKKNVVFILWGSFAQKKEIFIDSKKHYIIKAPHPSPLSSYRGFFGSKPFSKTNEYLNENGIDEIIW